MADDGYLPLVIKQGEDWTTEIIWTDNFDEPNPITHPCKLAIRSQAGQTIAELETDPDIPEGTVPTIAYSTASGLIQLHITEEMTAAMPAGQYWYDLFVTYESAGYAGNQTVCILEGPVTVKKRYTRI